MAYSSVVITRWSWPTRCHVHWDQKIVLQHLFRMACPRWCEWPLKEKAPSPPH